MSFRRLHFALLLCLSFGLTQGAVAQTAQEVPITPADINERFFDAPPQRSVDEPTLGVVYVQTNNGLLRQAIDWMGQRLGVPLSASNGQSRPLSTVLRDLCRQNRENDVGAVACPVSTLYNTGLEFVRNIAGESVEAANAVMNATVQYTLEQTANFIQNNLLRGTPLGGQEMQGITAVAERFNDWLTSVRKSVQNAQSTKSVDVERYLRDEVSGRRSIPAQGSRVTSDQLGEVVAAQGGVLPKAVAAGQTDLKQRLEGKSADLMEASQQDPRLPNGAVLESEARDEERKVRDRLALAVSSRAALQVGFESVTRTGVLQTQAANYQLQALRRIAEEQSRTTQMLGVVAKTMISQMDDALADESARQREAVDKILNESLKTTVEVSAMTRNTEERLQSIQTNPEAVFGDLLAY